MTVTYEVRWRKRARPSDRSGSPGFKTFDTAVEAERHGRWQAQHGATDVDIIQRTETRHHRHEIPVARVRFDALGRLWTEVCTWEPVL